MARLRHRVAKSSEKPEEDRKVHRLSNITVEEVSIVDKPANKRTFLVVKNEAGAAAGGVPPATPEPKPAALKISSIEKTKLVATFKAIEEKVAAIAKALEASEVVEGVATPDEVTKVFADIEKLIGVEVEKSGRKISSQRLEAMRQAHVLLGQVIAEAEPAVDPPVEPAAKSAAPPAAAPAVDADVSLALKQMTETMGVLVKAVSVQKKRIDELATFDGGSRQVPVEKAEPTIDGDEVEQSWPLDMNRPFKRDNTPVEKSFFAQR